MLGSFGAAVKVIGNLGRQESGAGKTTGLRIHTSHFDGERGPFCAFGGFEVYRNSWLSTLQSKTISPRDAIFTADKIAS